MNDRGSRSNSRNSHPNKTSQQPQVQEELVAPQEQIQQQLSAPTGGLPQSDQSEQPKLMNQYIVGFLLGLAVAAIVRYIICPTLSVAYDSIKSSGDDQSNE